jgi:hypothetical protein
MNEINTKFLHDGHPLLFTNSQVGFECGDGWFDLLNVLFYQISQYLEEHPELKIHINQVKEKFATLRFYYDITDTSKESTKKTYYDDEIFAYVRLAESLSSIICEECGAMKTQTVNVQIRKGGWMTTLCDACAKKLGRLTDAK